MKIKTFEEMKKYKVVKATNISSLQQATFDEVTLDGVQTFGNVNSNPCKPDKIHTSAGGTVFYVDITDKTHSKRRYCGNGCGHYYEGSKNVSHFGSATCSKSATCKRTLSNGKPDPDDPGCGKTWYADHVIGSKADGYQWYEQADGGKSHKWYGKCKICKQVVQTSTKEHSGGTCSKSDAQGRCSVCELYYTVPHNWTKEGYEGTHHSGKGHRAYRICGTCGKLDYYSPDKYIQNLLWDGYSYTSTHTNGKGHLKIGKCQLNKSGGGLCGVQENIPNDYFEKWNSTTKWFPYDERYCIEGKKCTANNCSFPSYGGLYNEEGYDDYAGNKLAHDMNTTTKVCKRCGWSDKPPQWEWTTSELNAFRGVSGYDVTDLTYTRWNEFVNHVQKVLNWYYGSGSKPSLSGASMSSSDKVLTARRFNTVRSAIGGMETTGIGDVYPGNIVYGSYFITLRDSLNNVRK